MNSVTKTLTRDSEYLVEFLETHVSHKLACFQKTKLSIESRKIIHLLFEKLADTHEKSPAITIKTTSFKTGNNYDLIDENIKQHINRTPFVGKTCDFHIHGHNIEINIFSDTNIPESYFKKIFCWLQVALEFSQRKCSQNLSIYLYLTDLEKTVPVANHSIDRINVNTGFTFPCKSKNEINIYRQEEWFKVFIHESFHNLGLDFSHHDSSRIDQKLLTLFPVNSEVRLCETYCEVWAEIINVLFIVFNTKRLGETLETLIKRTEKLLDYERMFSIFQSAKVLTHFGISYSQLYEKTDKAHMVRKMRYKENTPVLSYYIIKSFLMYNVNHFLEWCVSNNGLSIQFSHQDINRNLDSYFLLIQQQYQDKKYVECMNQLCDWFVRQEKTKRSIDIEMKSLRMSLFEIA